VIPVSVTSGAEEKVPTGGELTLFEAVGPAGLTCFCCVARRRVGDVWRGLKGAWPRPQQAVSAGRPLHREKKGIELMIVLGADMHKSSHTIAGIAATTGEMLGDKTVSVGVRGLTTCCSGRAVSAAIGCGLWKTAGMCRAPLSGS
jgi:hypothetical protein